MPFSCQHTFCFPFRTRSRKYLRELNCSLPSPKSLRWRTDHNWFPTQSFMKFTILFFVTLFSNIVFWWDGKRSFLTEMRIPMHVKVQTIQYKIWFSLSFTLSVSLETNILMHQLWLNGHTLLTYTNLFCTCTDGRQIENTGRTTGGANWIPLKATKWAISNWNNFCSPNDPFGHFGLKFHAFDSDIKILLSFYCFDVSVILIIGEQKQLIDVCMQRFHFAFSLKFRLSFYLSPFVSRQIAASSGVERSHTKLIRLANQNKRYLRLFLPYSVRW